MGAFLCTLSEQDWETALTKGVYGNRYYKEGTIRPHGDVQQLSIMRDLISMKSGDLVFFHIRGRQTIHGAYEVRNEAFFDDTPIWSDPTERFPYRFLFQPSRNFPYVCKGDANIDVQSLYELIDSGQIISLVTLEFEQNIEARSVRRILVEDALKMINLLHRDFRLRSSSTEICFQLMQPPSNAVKIRNKLFKVGNVENAIKAIVLHKLAHRDPALCELLGLPENYDFVNEFFVAQTTRKAIDILVKAENHHAILEFKTNECDKAALRQSLYYRDLLRQRSWIRNRDGILVVLIAQSFAGDLQQAVKKINYVNEPIKLVQYQPTDNGEWAEIYDATPS